MSADQIVAGIILAVIVAVFLLDALLPDKPAETNWTRPSGVHEASWSNVLGEDLPPMPVAHVEDVRALEWEPWEPVTGEVIEPEPRRQIGAGR